MLLSFITAICIWFLLYAVSIWHTRATDSSVFDKLLGLFHSTLVIIILHNIFIALYSNFEWVSFRGLMACILYSCVLCFSASTCRFCCVSFSSLRVDASCDYKDWSNGSESQPSIGWFLCTPSWSIFLQVQGWLLGFNILSHSLFVFLLLKPLSKTLCTLYVNVIT